MSNLEQVRTDTPLAESTFEQDESIKHLENRYSGQGHRTALKSRSQNNEPWEAAEARFGEERRLYLQDRGANPADYPPSGPRRGGADRFRELLGGYSGTTRNFSGGPRHLAEDHGRPSPPRASSHVRAPSPRSFGTTRFGPGGRRIEPTSSGLDVVSQSAAQANGAGRPLASTTATRQQYLSNGHAVQTNGISALPNGHASQANGHTTEPNGHTVQSNKHIAQPNATSSPRSEASGAAIHDHVKAQVYKYRALMYAATPGEECDEYHRLHPDRLQYLGPARVQLIREAIALAKKSSDAETVAYLKTHPERKGMIEAAAKAKSQVEDDNEDLIEAYCVAFPKHRDFLHAAKAHFTPKTKPSADDTRMKTVSEDKSLSRAKENGSLEQQTVSQAKQTTSLADQQTTSQVEQQTASQVEQAAAALVQQSSPAAADSSDSDKKSSVDTAISAPAQPNQGTLAATFFDIAGAFLGIHQVGIQAPVQVTMNITSRVRRFDPRELIHSIEALAQSMMNKSQGLGGAKLAGDGLWEEEEEL